MSSGIRSFRAHKSQGNPVTVWLVSDIDDLPLSGILEGDIAICTQDGLFYERILNTNGWTLVFDPADLVGSIAAEDVVGLQAAVESFLADELAAKANLSHTHVESDITNLVSDLAGKASSTHTHAQGDITNLTSDLAGKAASVHTHAISDVTSLQASLDAKSDTSHTHNGLVPTGGTTDQVLAKASNSNYDLTWAAAGAGGGLTSAQVVDLVYPVGAIYVSTVSTNPNTIFGRGTWAAFGTGRTLVGVDSGQTEFDTVEETGGAKTHTLTESEIPSHTHVQNSHNHTQDAHTHTQNAHNHTQRYHSATTGPLSGPTTAPDTSSNTVTNYGITTADTTATNQNTTATNQAATATNQNTGGGGAHNNLQPYITVYFWKRTA